MRQSKRSMLRQEYKALLLSRSSSRSQSVTRSKSRPRKQENQPIHPVQLFYPSKGKCPPKIDLHRFQPNKNTARFTRKTKPRSDKVVESQLIDRLLDRNTSLSEELGLYKGLFATIKEQNKRLKRQQDCWRGQAIYQRKLVQFGLSPE